MKNDLSCQNVDSCPNMADNIKLFTEDTLLYC